MAYPYTDTGYNMFDMLSMLQKAIRRGDYMHAGFAANQLKNTFRTAMWNRLFVISAEDCFGVVTKELVNLRAMDEKKKSDKHLSNSVAILCKSKKSRDACYFSCNFVLASRAPRTITPSLESMNRFLGRSTEKGKPDNEYDRFGFQQMTLFDEPEQNPEKPENDIDTKRAATGAALEIALQHRDMDMIGYEMDVLRKQDREFLWQVFGDIASRTQVENEISALKSADDIVNKNKSNKDEIFISKAAILLCYANDPMFETVSSSDMVSMENCIDWSSIGVKPISDCMLTNGEIPEWVYDCHTLKGKKMGKTDWDMTVTEQAALYPLQKGYFDDASWLYTYEQDLEMGDITEKQMEPIWEYARSHPVNPVIYIPYEDMEN